MRIKFRQGYEGPAGTFSPGDIEEIEKNIAINICNAGIAFPVKNKQIERQVKPEAEKQILDIADLEKRKGGHYYLNGEHFAHGKTNARKKLEKWNKG